jgi:hypothetical protein
MAAHRALKLTTFKARRLRARRGVWDTVGLLRLGSLLDTADARNVPCPEVLGDGEITKWWTMT